MPKLTPTRMAAATTAQTDIDKGTPEEAYQAINRAKMLWGFRLRDVDSWNEVIERWNHEPKAWLRIPDTDHPYGSPRRMIEAELDVDYDQFKEFVRIVLGTKAVALIDEPSQGHGGNRNPWGASGKPDNQGYARNLDSEQTKARGNTEAYLRQRILAERPDALDEIGKGKTYSTVNEAARKLGIKADRERLCVYKDDPAAAGRYMAQRTDRDWFMAFVDAYMASLPADSTFTPEEE